MTPRILALGCLLCSLLFSLPTSAAERPNVLLIAIDDLNDWVGCLGGHPQAKTPHIDSLANRGTLFTNAHCQAPICNPSRTSVMLGLRPSTTGIYRNSPWFRATERNRDQVTLPQYFREHGYETLTTGKIYHGSRVDEPSFSILGPRPGQRLKLDRRLVKIPGNRSRLWDNTVVVLWSDHGFHLGEKQRWAKQSLWERSTRVPLIVCRPGGRQGKGRGQSCARPVELLSIYPTLLELCGLPARQALEGTDITPLLDDPDADWERPALTTYQQDNHAVRSEHFRYIRYADGSQELYDHRRDPNEWHNLAGDRQYREVLAAHAKWLPATNAAEATRRAAGSRNQ